MNEQDAAARELWARVAAMESPHNTLENRDKKYGPGTVPEHRVVEREDGVVDLVWTAKVPKKRKGT